jgi:hypothetical protein
MAEKRLEKAMKAIVAVSTFDAVAAQVYEKKKAEGKADKMLQKYRWFAGSACPARGASPVREITAAEIFASRGRLRPDRTTKRLRKSCRGRDDHWLAKGTLAERGTTLFVWDDQ